MKMKEEKEKRRNFEDNTVKPFNASGEGGD
jgi:hypothetical protein